MAYLHLLQVCGASNLRRRCESDPWHVNDGLCLFFDDLMSLVSPRDCNICDVVSSPSVFSISLCESTLIVKFDG